MPKQRAALVKQIFKEIDQLDTRLSLLQEGCTHELRKKGNLVNCSICDKSELFNPTVHRSYSETISVDHEEVSTPPKELKILRPSKV